MYKKDNSIIINILGVEYPVKGDFEPEHILRLAESLNERMKELNGFQKVKSIEKTAVFTALNLENEIFLAREEKKSLISEIEGRTQKIIDRLDSALKEISP